LPDSRQKVRRILEIEHQLVARSIQQRDERGRPGRQIVGLRHELPHAICRTDRKVEGDPKDCRWRATLRFLQEPERFVAVPAQGGKQWVVVGIRLRTQSLEPLIERKGSKFD
jgi:hypothetical protein